jgi:hypothetical protein
MFHSKKQVVRNWVPTVLGGLMCLGILVGPTWAVAADCGTLANLKSPMEMLRKCATDLEAGRGCYAQGKESSIRRIEAGLEKAAKDAKCEAGGIKTLKTEFEALTKRITAAENAQKAAPKPEPKDPAPGMKGEPDARDEDRMAWGRDRLRKMNEDQESKIWLGTRDHLEEKVTMGEADRGETNTAMVKQVIADFAKLKVDCAGDDKALNLEAVKSFCQKITPKDEAIKKYVGASAKAIVATGMPQAYVGMVAQYRKTGKQFDKKLWLYISNLANAVAAEQQVLKPLFDYAGLPYPAAEVEKVVQAGQKLIFDAIDEDVAAAKPIVGKKSESLKKAAIVGLKKEGQDMSFITQVVAFEKMGDYTVVRNNIGTIVGRYTVHQLFIKVKGDKHCRILKGHYAEDYYGNGKYGNPEMSILSPGTPGTISFVKCP